jgi:RNA polymerase sigma-70 factor (ECF subfamily)
MTDLRATQFEAHRERLQGVAYRMLGSLAEAEDALQESWLRLRRAGEVENLGGWLTTVVARVCLDMLRARKTRSSGEQRSPALSEEVNAVHQTAPDAEQEAVLAESIGLALLVVLDSLKPAERVAFVLHDLFALPFDEIAKVLGRTLDATRQLASRARRRVQGAPAGSDKDLARQRDTVNAFLTALRAGDVEAIVSVLDPDVVVHGAGRDEIRGARRWASGAVRFSRMARFIQPAIVDGAVGLILAPHGRLQSALRFAFSAGKISQVEVINEPARISQLEVSVLTA